jgi:hypothetical protein
MHKDIHARFNMRKRSSPRECQTDDYQNGGDIRTDTQFAHKYTNESGVFHSLPRACGEGRTRQGAWTVAASKDASKDSSAFDWACFVT